MSLAVAAPTFGPRTDLSDAHAPGAPDPDQRERDLIVIETEMTEIIGRMNLLHHELVGLVDSTLTRGLLQGCGYASPAQWLAIWTGLAPERCRQIVRAAEAAGDFPCTLAQLGSGAITFDQAMTVISAAPSWADAQASRMVQWATVSQMRRILGRYQFGEDPRGSEEPPGSDGSRASDDTSPGADHGPDRDRPGNSADDERTDDNTLDNSPDNSPAPGGAESSATPDPTPPRPFEEYLRLLPSEDGSWSLHGRLGPEAGLLLDAALREACDGLELVPAGAGHRLRPDAVAGLTEMCRRSLAAIPDPARADRYRIYLHLDAASGRFTDPYGMQLPPAVAATLACEAEIRPVRYERGLPVSVGRTLRTVPAHTRRLILQRDQGCRVPGCTARTHLHVHHIIEWSHGGPTDTGNLISLCGTHHRHLHHGRLRITGPPGTAGPVNADMPHGVRFLTDRGRVLGFSPIPAPSGPAADPPVRFLHPSGERYDAWSVYFNPPKVTAPDSDPDPDP